MESTSSGASLSTDAIEIRLLGPLTVARGGVAVALPPSRKIRALLAYLAVAGPPVSRERLCDLLWEIPSDPRGELRWTLSKLRGLLDGPGRRRVISAGDRVGLDLEGCVVDATDVMGAVRAGLDRLGPEGLQALAARFRGDFLEGVAIDHAAGFGQWLAAMRSEIRSCHIDILAAIGERLPQGSPDALAAIRRWLDLAPFDIRAHVRFLAELHRRGMAVDCAAHLSAAAGAFGDAGLDFTPVRQAFEGIVREGAAIHAIETAAPAPDPTQSALQGGRRASVAVMPFRELHAGTPTRSGLGDAIAHDVISRLARLRSLFVIARGSVFAIADEPLAAGEIGRRLGVDYVATGFIEKDDARVVVTVEVADAATARIVWTDRFEARSSDRLALLGEIGDGIVSSIASEIENAERNRAILKHPGSLDAWEAYHRGLWHMYRFTREENDRAAEFFRLSARLDPTFSRAHAGLSFTHWQNAFQRWGDRAAEARMALEAAGRSLLVDEQNPAAHWSMGRALWMAGDNDGAVRELERSVGLSPNFALGHYALAFVHCQAGDPQTAIASSDQSRLLSPCDPLLFGILASRAMALVRLERFEEAADWSLEAAARPNAHAHILAIAAHCLALAGRVDEARQFAARLRRQYPAYTEADFLETFRFAADAMRRYSGAASLIGLGG